MGDEAAADLVDWMQQLDTHRAELRELNELMYARFDSRMNELRDVTAARIAELKVALAGVESRIDRRFADLLKWSFLFWCGAVGAAVLARWPR